MRKTKDSAVKEWGFHPKLWGTLRLNSLTEIVFKIYKDWAEHTLKSRALERQRTLKDGFSSLCAHVINTTLSQKWQLFLFFLCAGFHALSLGSLFPNRCLAGQQRESGGRCWHVCRPRFPSLGASVWPHSQGREALTSLCGHIPAKCECVSKTVTQTLIFVILLRYQQQSSLFFPPFSFPRSSSFPTEKMTQICGRLKGGMCLSLCMS